MKNFLTLFTILSISILVFSSSSIIDSNLMRLEDYNNLESIVYQMAQMGVNHINKENTKNEKYNLASVDVENVKMYGAVEKKIVLKIEDKSKTMAFTKKWFDINFEETKYLLDDKPLFEEINLDHVPSTQLSLLEDPSNNYKMNLVGPLKINIEKNSNPVFELPKRLEIHSTFDEILLERNSEIEISNINSISLSKPLKINTINKNGLIGFEIQDIPSLNVKILNKNSNPKISSKEKSKLKIDNRRKHAIIQSTNTKQLTSPVNYSSFLFTNKFPEFYLEANQTMKSKNLKFTEIVEVSYKNIRLIQIPAKLKEANSYIPTNYQIFLAFDFENLPYVASVTPTVQKPSLISFPKLVNNTIANDIINLVSHRVRL